jgi:hypothetical protein
MACRLAREEVPQILTNAETGQVKSRQVHMSVTRLIGSFLCVYRSIDCGGQRDSIMSNYLRIRFLDDKDGTGKLLARAEADGFSGESGAIST